MKIKKAAVCFILTAILLTSCSQDAGKINVLKGPGAANESTLIGFNRLCSGTAEAFIGGSSLLVSEESGGIRSIYQSDVSSGSRKLLFTTPVKDSSPMEISADGKLVLCGSSLYHQGNGSVENLPPFTYSFSGGNEVLLSDPYYYIKKYNITGSNLQETIPALVPAALLRLGDKRPAAPFSGFSNLRAPRLDYIISQRLLIEDLKYIFTGKSPDSGKTPLYVLDLYKKDFIILDENVRYFTLSPDGRSLAYISVRDSQPDRLMVSDTSGKASKELMKLEYISGVEWSRNANLIAWSGGRKNRCDVGIIKADGTSAEQLTNAMYSGPGLVWSPDGGMLAFSSRVPGKSPETYVITLEKQKDADIAVKPASDPAKAQLSSQMLDLLRKETASVYKFNKM